LPTKTTTKCQVDLPTCHTYPVWHWYDGFALGTKMQMQDNDGNDNSEDAQADDE